jgi:hypothetical protein
MIKIRPFKCESLADAKTSFGTVEKILLDLQDATIPEGGATGQVLTKVTGANYDADWVTPSGGGGGSVSDTAYGVSWNGVTTIPPSKNAIYDKIESLSINTDGGNASSVGVAALAVDGGTA